MTGPLECGLVEMDYPTIGTLCEATTHGLQQWPKRGIYTTLTKIEAGYYDSPERVIPAINKKVTLSYRYT